MKRTLVQTAVMLFGIVALAAIYGHAQGGQFGDDNPWPSIGSGTNSNPGSNGGPFSGGSGSTSGGDSGSDGSSSGNDNGDGNGNSDNGGGSSSPGGGGSGGSAGGNGAIEPIPTATDRVDMYNLMFSLPVAHGALAAVAFGFFFPLGSILMRVIPGRTALYSHGFTQLFAYATYIAGAGLGIYFVSLTRVRGTNASILESAMTNAHPIIGLVLLVALFIQPILGVAHHARFKKIRRRTWVSHVHLWTGRLGITLGIINGGLGFALAKWNGTYITPAAVAAYAIIAGFMWIIWVLTALRGEYRRRRDSTRDEKLASEERSYRPVVRGGGACSTVSPSEGGRHRSSSVSHLPSSEAGLPPYEPGPNYAAHTAHLRRASFDIRREMTRNPKDGIDDRRPDPGPIQSATDDEMRRGQV
ncbi:hypothetical protein F5Y08DRAFT_317386 [Xylaria arbuscula]|nr:hypothetical protein F5Y08DRAFT_317386 [Xylaria arbuscula]